MPTPQWTREERERGGPGKIHRGRSRTSIEVRSHPRGPLLPKSGALLTTGANEGNRTAEQKTTDLSSHHQTLVTQTRITRCHWLGFVLAFFSAIKQGRTRF